MDQKPWVVFSDDLTGSMGLSILLKNEGVDVEVLTLPERETEIDFTNRVLVVNTDTRGKPGKEAEEAMRTFVSRFKGKVEFGKRFDTTLRGYLHMELEVILDAHPKLTALIVPAYPSGERITVGGYQLLKGSLLENTEVADDPDWPITSSYVPGYFNKKYEPRLYSLEELHSLSPEGLKSSIEADRKEYRIIIFDSGDEGDVDKIAEATALMEGVLPVSTGVYVSRFLGKRLAPQKKTFSLAIVGSTTVNTGRQVAYIESKNRTAFIDIESSALERFDEERIESLIRDINCEEIDLLIVRTTGPVLPEKRRDLVEILSLTGMKLLREQKDNVNGLILSGGETAIELLKQMDAQRIEPKVELDPLIMGGRVSKGEFEGLKILTKGGLMGDLKCLHRALIWFRKDET